MFSWCNCLAPLILYLYILGTRSLDCDEPSVVIECLYDPDSGSSCGLRLEQSLRLFNVVDSKVVKRHEWLDETVIREEIDAIQDLRSYLDTILGDDNTSYDSIAYVLYICRFRPFSCARASRYRQGSRVNETEGSSITKMRSVRETMRARWSVICHRMVWLERHLLPRYAFWKNESTGTFHCTMQRNPIATASVKVRMINKLTEHLYCESAVQVRIVRSWVISLSSSSSSSDVSEEEFAVLPTKK